MPQDWRDAPDADAPPGGDWRDAPTIEEWEQMQLAEQPPARTRSEETFRQLGLTGRYILETPALTFAGLGDLLGKVANVGLAGADIVAEQFGSNVDYRHTPVAPRIHEGFTRMGFPEPENATERYVERAARGAVGVGMGMGVGRAMAAGEGTPSAVGGILTQQPGMQVIGSTTGAAGGQAMAEAGAPPWAQTGAELITGAAGPLAVGAAIPGYNLTAGTTNAMTRAGQRRIVGEVMREEATNPALAARNIETAPTGITPKTTAEAARDPGLLGLERMARARGTAFASRDSARNRTRQEILDVMGGEDVAITRATRKAQGDTARSAVEREFIQKKMMVPGWAIERKIDDMLRVPGMSQEAVEQSLNHFKQRIKDLSNENGQLDVRDLYAIRKDVNYAMQGRLSSGDKQPFKLAKGQLKQVKIEIDNMIERMVPGWKKYLDDYSRMSTDIERREIIQRIQREKVLATSVDPQTNLEVLSLAGVKRAVRKEIQDQNLSEEQLGVLTTIVDDMDSGAMFQASGIRPPGSDTARNLTMSHILGRTLGGRGSHPVVQTMSRPLRWITQASEDQVQELLTDALLDPTTAKLLLAEATVRNSRRLDLALKLRAKALGFDIGAIVGASRTMVEGTDNE